MTMSENRQIRGLGSGIVTSTALLSEELRTMLTIHPKDSNIERM
jgi:hypothetical protein